MQPRVTALLLGAGLSRRMGCCKQLLPLDGRPAIVWCLQSILAAGITELTVVVGPAGEEGAKVSGVLVCLADHPLVTAETFRLLIEEHRRTPETILIPAYRGKKGHPSLFPRSLIMELATLSTLRDVIGAYPERVRVTAVDDPAVIEDMDTPADYQRLVARLTPS